MVSPFLLGAINGPVLLLAVVGLVVAGGLALRRLHRGEPAPLVAVAVALIAPLVFVAWAGTAQHDASMHWAMTHPAPLMKQTWMAAMLSRTIATQLYGGLIVAIGGVVVLVGALAVTVRGERPRWLVASVAGGLGVGLVGVALVAVVDVPAVVLAGRLVGYVAAVGVGAMALLAAHRRGPGVQLATLVCLVLPLVVVATDVAVLGGVSSLRLTEVAAAPAAEKQALFDAAVGTLEVLQASAWMGLALAASIGVLGPAAVWRRERPHASAALVAFAAVLVLAGVGLSTTLSWTAPWH